VDCVSGLGVMMQILERNILIVRSNMFRNIREGGEKLCTENIKTQQNLWERLQWPCMTIEQKK
jgi:hypothetical protein